jgi:hypothetical protein
VEKDDNGVDKFTVSVLIAERPGQPIRLTGKDTFARLLKELADSNEPFAFDANLSGNPIPYLFVTSIEVL